MRPHSLRPSLVLAAACLLAVLLFLVMTATPGGHFWGRYLIPIVVVFLWGRRRDIYVVTALASVLIVADFWFDGALVLGDLLSNHLLPLIVLWSIAWLLAGRQKMHERLAAREEQLAKIFRANPGGIAIIRQSDGCFLDANDVFLAMVGYSREELIGHTILELGILSAESRAEVTDALRAQGHLRGRGVRLTNASGKPVDIVYSTEQIEFDGEPCYLGLMVDVTERKQLEEGLAAGEARLRAVIENTDDSVWSVDGSYRLLVGNSVFARGVEQIIGRLLAPGECVVAAPFPQSARALWQPLYDRALAGESFAVEMPSGMRAGGTWICHLHPIYAADGTTAGVSCRAADITALKQAEAALRQVNRRLQLAVDAANIGIWTWNLADDSLEWDERMCELYGVLPEQRSAGLNYELWRARVHPEDRGRAEPSHNDAIHANSPWSSTFRIVLPDGDIRYIQVNAVKEYDEDGQPLQMLGVNRNVTDQVHYDLRLQDTNAELERRVAERTADLEAALAEVQAANRLKDEFMAMISHELRTPLTGVLSMSELLGEQISGPLNARQAVYVRSVSESGERLLYVINNILGYTHLISGKLLLRHEPCELGYLLHVCAVSQRAKAEAKQQAIEELIEPEGLSIESDAEALGEVIKRLLDNAIKFTPAGGRVGLAAYGDTSPGSVQLVVWDTGPGLTREQLARLITPFAQGDGGLARVHEGLGMGLAYVDQMVRLLGGELAVAPNPGGGSRFMINLPGEPIP